MLLDKSLAALPQELTIIDTEKKSAYISVLGC